MQAIYSWRGGSGVCFEIFSDLYPHAETHPLEINFRSTRAIVAAASSLINKVLASTLARGRERQYLHCAVACCPCCLRPAACGRCRVDCKFAAELESSA